MYVYVYVYIYIYIYIYMYVCISENLTNQEDNFFCDSEFHAFAIIRQILMKNIPVLL